jgi:hypothetical protein
MNCVGKTTLKPAYEADKGASGLENGTYECHLCY